MKDSSRPDSGLDQGDAQGNTIGRTDDMAAPGSAGDDADLASTDGSQTPSSRADGTQPLFGEAPAARAVSDLHDMRDRHLRLAAEFDNYKKRVARERSELSDRAQATFIARLLDVLDDLDRLVATDSAAAPDTLSAGLALVDKKLRKELESAGVERIDPVGQPFNPAEHEAVSIIPPPDAALDHTVSATFQTGYRFKGTLVRPARVQVYSEGQA